MTKSHTFIVFTLLALLIILLWLAPPDDLLDITSEKKINNQRPNAYLVNSKTIQYNIDGSISYVLNSDLSRYFEANSIRPEKLTELTNPLLLNYTNDKQQPPWKISSRQAITRNNQEELLMTGNVELIQTHQNNTITTISTEQLIIQPEQQYAETDRPVMIKNSAGTTTAVGLTISLDKNILTLLSEVRSRYEAH